MITNLNPTVLKREVGGWSGLKIGTQFPIDFLNFQLRNRKA